MPLTTNDIDMGRPCIKFDVSSDGSLRGELINIGVVDAKRIATAIRLHNEPIIFAERGRYNRGPYEAPATAPGGVWRAMGIPAPDVDLDEPEEADDAEPQDGGEDIHAARVAADQEMVRQAAMVAENAMLMQREQDRQEAALGVGVEE